MRDNRAASGSGEVELRTVAPGSSTGWIGRRFDTRLQLVGRHRRPIHTTVGADRPCPRRVLESR
ncbi:MAG: hypothetical protein CMJ51_01575 [Planctomycetaceae bacterium]|nr:hypothetical protein [Planctomycetaceae bacterium]